MLKQFQIIAITIIACLLTVAVVMTAGYYFKQTNTPSQPVISAEVKSMPTLVPFTQIDLEPSKSTTPEKLAAISSETKYGHFSYSEANLSETMIIASYAQQQEQRFERMSEEAAVALMKMIYAARDDGVWLVPVSGFRDISKQKLLFESQIQRRGSIEAASKVSAPPGYSEHHTGYAIDLTDGSILPSKDITYEFEQSPSFRWLKKHAQDFNFEISFLPNNSQGVMYEPWHWRYIGSPKAKMIFAQAK